jgi:hypothetical protein
MFFTTLFFGILASGILAERNENAAVKDGSVFDIDLL